MADGAKVVCRRLLKSGHVDSILSLGGTMGTNWGYEVVTFHAHEVGGRESSKTRRGGLTNSERRRSRKGQVGR
jgi:hypothetical protein